MDEAVWHRHYTKSAKARLEGADGTMLDVFRSAVALAGDRPAIQYFDTTLSYADLDRLSDGLAAALIADGFAPGDRLALMLQNMPQFVIAMLAAWKAGGMAVTINPMNREREVEGILADATPHSVVVLDALVPIVRAAADALDAVAPRLIVVGADRMQARNDRRVIPQPAPDVSADTFDALAETPVGPGGLPGVSDADAVALLVYTSGTTGKPKGAMLTHRNLATNARIIMHWYDLDKEPGAVLAMAPFFHVTGLVGHIAVAIAARLPLVLTWRFEPGVVLDAIAEYRPGFTIGAMTAYVALTNVPGVTRDHFASFHTIVSGGAAVPPALVASFKELTGLYMHNGYGLTETSAGVIAVPAGREAPVDPASGTLAVGVPVSETHAWIADDDGHPVAIGEIGEIVISGPTVASGYWQRPEESAEAMRADGFRTGDIGFVDAQGWVYVVDRKKDMINAAGYKVWPREVEDVLYGHPAIREAAVVGVVDAYRGETVRAVVSLRDGQALDGAAMQAWCRDRLAAYKLPREMLIVGELPKTPSGKILRKDLRGDIVGAVRA
ncbi:class I adenylate-forming enzyme family protein [Novosphingobium sp. Fuku2-ISO-50]|uniref:class I adenylate-forming enzyme family protein n=1 Tax=Novosphingobium sp. Fuku2-ISO-50 TaxID=1739114 RepID=UPI000A743FCD|nr:AMP-binding protein [Novosphingobium sp. Fuku2-ISO-50]